MTGPVSRFENTSSYDPINKVSQDYIRQIAQIQDEFHQGNRNGAIDLLDTMINDIERNPSIEDTFIFTSLVDAKHHAVEGNVSWALATLNEVIQRLNP